MVRWMVKELTYKEFNQIRNYAAEVFGIHLADEKQTLVYSRLRPELIRLGMEDFSTYFSYLQKDAGGDALRDFVDRLTTNHTYFMREPAHFSFVKEIAFPEVKEVFGKEKDLRFWCAGCSTGEEAYTLEMLALDFFRGENWNTDLLATDISTRVLDVAVAGIYGEEHVKDIPNEWKKRYFTNDGSNYVVKQQVKDRVYFRHFNLITEVFSFKKPMHIIFCRNVMIYFDKETRKNLVNRFYDALHPGGYLFIGHSESLNHIDVPFEYVQPAVYRK